MAFRKANLVQIELVLVFDQSEFIFCGQASLSPEALMIGLRIMMSTTKSLQPGFPVAAVLRSAVLFIVHTYVAADILRADTGF